MVAPKPVLSICTGIGVLDRAFIDQGFRTIPGCEVNPEKRELYKRICGGDFIAENLDQLIELLEQNPIRVQGIIGGPPCQYHSKTKYNHGRVSKFPELHPQVIKLVELVNPEWYLFENVVRIHIEGGVHSMCNAMHYAKPHQSRQRWFTHTPNIIKPEPIYAGRAYKLMAHVCVSGKNYDLRRAMMLQGFPEIWDIEGDYQTKLDGIVNAVHYELASRWAEQVKERKR